MLATDLLLLPKPRQLRAGEGSFVPVAGQRIVLEGMPQALLGAARRLQVGLRLAGVEWELAATALGPAAEVGVVLKLSPAQTPQGYQLSISPAGISLVGHDPAGVFYGVCTLLQIVQQAGAQLPSLTIEDWPDFPVRGVMLDISRDKVPTLETLYQLIDMLAGWKVNQLQLYTEHTFAYRQHPEPWAAASPITGEEILLLDAYCAERFVELVPNQNCFGHMHRWLKLDRYRHLAEAPDGCETRWGFMEPFSLCPGDPGSLALVGDMLDELLPHFSSVMVNVGCDETVDLGQGRSRAECERRGVGRVYLDFLLKIEAAVRARGRTMQFWGDIIMEHPELVGELPRDLVALEWGYEADHPFSEHSARFAASGVPFYVCPGTSSWNSIAGRTANAVGNLRSAAEHGLRHGAIGYLITDWGDRGHWQLLPVSYLGFAMGAAYSWAWQANRDLDPALATGLHALQDATGAAGHAAVALGDVYRALGVEPHNSSGLFWMLQQPIAEWSDAYALPSATLERVRQAIDAALEPLEEARMTGPDAALIAREFEQTARLMRHACQRGALRLERDPARVAALKRELVAELDTIIEEQRTLWLARNRPGGLSDSLARFEPARQDYA